MPYGMIAFPSVKDIPYVEKIPSNESTFEGTFKLASLELAGLAKIAISRA